MHMQAVCGMHFGCETIADYHDVYLQLDVLLLVDFFEKFRRTCLDFYSLNPLHYYTTPGRALRMSRVEQELITDEHIYNLIENIYICRGGGAIFSICSVLISNTLPQLEQSSLHPQQSSVITSCYRPHATTISVFSYTSIAPVKKISSSNRLGTPGAFSPSTHYRNQLSYMSSLDW